MALNLWKVGGQPTNYNPLPSGYNNAVTGQLTSYVVSFYASSKSNATLTFTDSGYTNFTQNFSLTNVRNFYTYSFTRKTFFGANAIQFIDSGNKGDIVIDSINLVQAPLNQLTINGLDGFLSGKWTFDPNATVINDSTFVLNASGSGFTNNSDYIPVLPNATYTFNSNFQSGSFCKIFGYDINKSNGYNVNNNVYQTTTFTVNSTTYFIKVQFGASSAGTFTFSKPVLNLGSIPAPYSKKTGNTMVLPTAKKNLVYNPVLANFGYNRVTLTDTFNGYIQAVSNQTSSTDNYMEYHGQQTLGIFNTIPVKPKTTYTGSIIARSDGNMPMYLRLIEIGAGGTVINDHVAPNQYNTTDTTIKATWTTDPRTLGILIRVQFPTNVIGYTAWVKQGSLQLEQSTIATPSTPYAVQVGKIPQRYVPKKNLFDGNYAFNYWGVVNVINTVNADGSFTIQNNNYATPRATSPNFPASWGGKTITCSVNVNSISAGQTYKLSIYDTKGSSYLGTIGFTSTGWKSVTATLPADCTGCQFWVHPDIISSTASVTVSNAQAEFGTVATPYEAYTPVLPPSNKGMFFNGVSDYLTVPAMSIDAIEFDINIDPTQTTNQIMLQTSSTGTTNANTNGTIANISSVLVNSSTYSGTLPKGSRIKVRYNFTTPTNEIMDVLTNATKAYCVKSVLYSLKCYYQGNVVVSYDFTNPSTITGNTVLNSPAPQNLLPSFEDPRWNINSTMQVIGKDTIHQNATANGQNSTFRIYNVSGQTFYGNCGLSKGFWGINFWDVNNSNVGYVSWRNSPTTFTVPSNAASMTFEISNNASGSGNFDYYKPQLYKVDGTQGTISGSPISQMKQSKRLLYSKR